MDLSRAVSKIPPRVQTSRMRYRVRRQAMGATERGGRFQGPKKLALSRQDRVSTAARDRRNDGRVLRSGDLLLPITRVLG